MTHDNDDIDDDFPQAAPDRLYAHNRRQLSAMLDGELSPDQARFMLRRLQHDAELAACWERWQVCGDVLRGRGHALLPADFSRRVAAAIAAPEAGAAAKADGAVPAARGRGQHRLLRWGGGALAASVALVALFMARQLPDPQSPGVVEAAGAARSAPAVVVADAGQVAAPVESPRAPAGGPDVADAAALLAAAAPAAIAVAEVPRRAAGERGSTRSQAQRAALRRLQAEQAPVRMVAAAAPRPAAPDASAAMASADRDALFGAPVAAARPWPRAVLPGLSRSQPFAAGYGLPQAEVFAPFQPRLQRDAADAARQPRAAAPDPAASGSVPADEGSGVSAAGGIPER